MTQTLEVAPMLNDRDADKAFRIALEVRAEREHHEAAERFAMDAETSHGLEAVIFRALARLSLRRAGRAHARVEAIRLGL